MYRIGTSKRDYDPVSSGKAAFPAPNNYNPKVMEKTTPPQWLFGTGKRPPLQSLTGNPGPGTYESIDKVFDGPKVNLQII